MSKWANGHYLRWVASQIAPTWNKVKSLPFLGKYAILTNTLTWSALLGFGDCIAQSYQKKVIKEKIKILKGDLQNINISHDWQRTGRMMMVGLITGPLNHTWYYYLDKFVPFDKKKAFKSVAKKIALDEAINSPVHSFVIFQASAYFNGRSPKMALDEYKMKYPMIYMTDLSMWPAAQFINFYFLPSSLRLTYVALVTVFWNAYLCCVMHEDLIEEAEKHLSTKDQMYLQMKRMLNDALTFMGYPSQEYIEELKKKRKAAERKEKLEYFVEDKLLHKEVSIKNKGGVCDATVKKCETELRPKHLELDPIVGAKPPNH